VRTLAWIVILAFAAGEPAGAIINSQPAADYESENALRDHLASWAEDKPFPFWKNIGQIDRSTGIYLGNGYVLTAAHVGAGTFRTSDGKSYSVAGDTVQFFRNHDGSLADLCLFRIAFQPVDPIASCPAIPLTTMIPRKGNRLVLLAGGAGPKSSGKRFAWSDDYRVRWGLNSIEEVYAMPMPTSRYSSFGFATHFGKDGAQCQAAPGDSGGAAFHFNPAADRWELAGVIVAVDSRFGGADFGNQTYVADPALFRRQLAVARESTQPLLASGP